VYKFCKIAEASAVGQSLTGDKAMDLDDPAEAAWRFVGGDAYLAYVAHPDYGDCARLTLGNWALKIRKHARIERALHDLTHWLAAEAAVALAAEPDGLTAQTLEQLLLELKVASRGRGGLLLAYLQYRGLIEPEEGGRGRYRRYRPTSELTDFMKLRFRRDMEVITALDPAIGAVLARWDEPGVFDRAMAAGRSLAVCSVRYKRPREVSLEPIIERKHGMTILGQILLSEDDGSDFPRRDAVRLNVVDIARRSGAERHQVMHVLKLARQRGFILDRPDGSVVFAPGLIERIQRTLGMYWRALVWRARAALAG
jgi:hypothetical protein